MRRLVLLGALLFWAGLFVLVGVGHSKAGPLPTLSDVVDGDEFILYASLLVISFYLVLNTVSWYVEYTGWRRVALVIFEGVQNGLLGATLASDSGHHRNLAIAFVCVWYAKLTLFPYNAKNALAQIAIVAASAACLGYFAFKDGAKNQWEYAGMFLIALTNIPPYFASQKEIPKGFVLIQ